MSGPLPLHPIQAVYVTVLGLSGLLLGAMNYWIRTRASTSRIRTALLHHNVAILWLLVAAAGLLVEHQQLSLALVYLRTVLAYATTVLFVRFATLYSGRSTSLRRPVNAAYVAGTSLGLLALVTNPWHGLHFEPLVYHTDPFPYYETGLGPFWQFSFLVSYLGNIVALYYFVQLSFTSQFRSNRPLVIYSLGMILALVPSVLTAVSAVPTLPGYDHSVFGVSIASIAFFAGAWLGMARITPISRDRLLEASGSGLVVVDNSDTVVDYTDGAETFFTEQNPIGKRLDGVAPTLASVRSAEDSREGGDDVSAAFDHQNHRYSVVVSSLTDGERQCGEALLIRDVTERAERQTELRRQNEQLDEFASSVSHYLRNPLQIASGQVELVDQHFDTDGTERERLEDLAGALERMETIIDDLETLATSGKSVESTEFLWLGEATETATSHLQTADATITIERDGRIRADRGRLLSILENLVKNSVDHAGPAVSIRVAVTDDGFVFEDDGPGIDADDDRLFEYGYTTSSEGTGLGLSIVRTMVESHGWSIRVDPDHDGARFVVSGAVTEIGPRDETATEAS